METFLQNTIDVLDWAGSDKNIVIGDSMGGYLMLALALKRPDRINCLIGLAAGFGKSIYETRKSFSFDNITVNNDRLIDKKLDINIQTFLYSSTRDENTGPEQSKSILENISGEKNILFLSEQAPHSGIDENDLPQILNFITQSVL